MDTYIQQAYSLSLKVVLNTYTYFSYFLTVFTFLFQTFPINVLTVLVIAVFFVRSILKRAQSNKFSIQVWKAKSEEMEKITTRLQDMLSKLSKKIAETNSKASSAKKTKYDYRFVKNLDQQKKNNEKELSMLQKQLQKLQKYGREKQSFLKQQENLRIQLEALGFCCQKYIQAKRKAASFFDKNLRSKIQFLLFRVYCIMI